MALAPTLLERATDGTDASVYTTGSLTPTVGRPVTVTFYQDDGSAAPALPAISGTNGFNGTFTLLATRSVDTFRRVSMWLIEPVSGTAGTISFTFTADNQDRATWEVVEWTDLDAATTISLANDSVLQNAFGVPVTSVSHTLAAFAAGSATYIVLYLGSTSPTITEEGGYTVIGSVLSAATPNVQAISAWKATSDTSPSFSWSSNSAYQSIAVELAAASVTAYTITADAGSYAVTGTAADLKQGYRVTADSGSVAITGTAATLSQGVRITADPGSIAVTGTAVSFGIVRLGAAGSYEVTGTTASLLAGRKIVADSGSVAVTGQAATLSRGREVDADSGSIAITGTAAALKRGLVVTAASGSLTITGVTASLEQGYVLTAAAGSYTLTGQASGLVPVFLTLPSPRNVLDVPHLNWFVELR